MRKILALALATLLMPLVEVGHAEEYNFYTQMKKQGCASIITEQGQRDCAAVQDAKDKACKVATDCEPKKQERLITEYKDAKERLDRGQFADADKDKVKEKVERLRDLLDRAKSAARDGKSLANECVVARENVQKWFAEVGIRLTERTRDEALRLRRELLDKLADAQRKHSDAKSKRDAKPGDSSAKSDADRAEEDMRRAEKALGDFNAKYGNGADIEDFAYKLIRHYEDERKAHDKPLSDDKNRRDNCEKIDNMSY